MEFTPRLRQGPLLALIFCMSGASALAYQVVWVRQLTLVLGGSALAVSTILATFMAGLGLGSWFGGRLADRLRRPLCGYAIAEILIAACALATPVLLSTSGALYLGLHKAFGGAPLPVTIARTLAAAAILLVPTTMMGATLPFMVRYYVRGIDHLGRGLGLLYGINIVGGVIGAAVSGYYSIHTFGVRRTLLFAIAANLTAALAALALALFSRRLSQPPAAPNDAASAGEAPRAAGGTERLLPLLFAGLTMSGFTVLAYEVLWTRALNFAIGNSVYAFTTVLVVTLTGLFLGAFLAGPLADRSRTPLRTIGWIQGLAAIATLAALSVVEYFPRLTTILVDRWGAGTPLGDIVSKVVPAAAALLLPTLFSGVTFPFLLRTATTRFEGLGKRLGSGYALNTAGAIVGSLAAGFVLLPALGTTRGVLAVVSVQMAMGTIFLLRSEGTRSRRLLSGLSLAATVAVLVAIFAVRPAPLIRHTRSATGDNTEILFWQEGRTASVSVVRLLESSGREKQRNLYINLLGAATTSPDRRHEQYYTLLSALPAVLHPSPRQVFVAGVASGVTTGAAALDARTERVVSVEISPEVIRAATLFSESNYDAVHNPRITLIADDARAYLAATDERFDIIVTDCFLSAVTGTAALYSREYFDLCGARLAPGGFMSIGADRLGGVDRVVVRTFLESFPHAALFMSPDRRAYCVSFLIGANEPIQFSRAPIEAALQQPLLGGELARFAFPDIDVLAQSYLCGRERLLDLIADAEICSDDRPVIDFAALAWAEGFRTPVGDSEMMPPGVRRLLRTGRDPFPWRLE